MDFKGKKIAIIGGGVEGQSTLKYLSDKGAELYLLDQKEDLGSIETFGAKKVLGQAYLDDLDQYDLIFRSAGVNPNILKVAQEKVTSQTKLFFDQCSLPIIGVTGTKGKGTTSTLIYEILKEVGKSVFLAGNIGKPPLELIGEIGPDSLVVLELSSFQLVDLDKSPHIAVVLMVTSEHLDWHENAVDYIKAKERIVKYQTEQDIAVINRDFPSSMGIGQFSKGQKYYFSTKDKVEKGAYVESGNIVLVTNGWSSLIRTDQIKLPGPHNLQNVCAAAAVAGILEASHEVIAKAISNFKGLEHRLEFVSEIEGVKYYNDSASTTPETAIAAIKAFPEPKVLILGGSSKKSDFSHLGKTIIESGVKAVILIGQEAQKIKQSISNAGDFQGEIIEDLKNMTNIVKKAKEISKSGDIVILSPACASFDMFESYIKRGIEFKKAVNG